MEIWTVLFWIQLPYRLCHRHSSSDCYSFEMISENIILRRIDGCRILDRKTFSNPKDYEMYSITSEILESMHTALSESLRGSSLNTIKHCQECSEMARFFTGHHIWDNLFTLVLKSWTRKNVKKKWFFWEESLCDQCLFRFVKISKSWFGASKTVPAKVILKSIKFHFSKISGFFLIFMKDLEGDWAIRNFFEKVEPAL